MSSHYPSYVSELYSAYAAGRLSPSFALMVETQASLRTDIRQDVQFAEAVAGAMLEEEELDRMAPNAFETALRAIDAEAGGRDDAALAAANRAGDAVRELLGLPEPLRERALDVCATSGWKRLTRGVSRLDLGLDQGEHAHLYRIEPGHGVPRHSHKADEYTLVVQGGFTDASGSFGPGDISCQTPEDTHQPVADEDGVCIALAVSGGGLKFTGVLGFLQKIAGRRES